MWASRSSDKASAGHPMLSACPSLQGARQAGSPAGMTPCSGCGLHCPALPDNASASHADAQLVHQGAEQEAVSPSPACTVSADARGPSWP